MDCSWAAATARQRMASHLWKARGPRLQAGFGTRSSSAAALANHSAVQWHSPHRKVWGATPPLVCSHSQQSSGQTGREPWSVA